MSSQIDPIRVNPKFAELRRATQVNEEPIELDRSHEENEEDADDARLTSEQCVEGLPAHNLPKTPACSSAPQLAIEINGQYLGLNRIAKALEEKSHTLTLPQHEVESPCSWLTHEKAQKHLLIWGHLPITLCNYKLPTVTKTTIKHGETITSFRRCLKATSYYRNVHESVLQKVEKHDKNNPFSLPNMGSETKISDENAMTWLTTQFDIPDGKRRKYTIFADPLTDDIQQLPIFAFNVGESLRKANVPGVNSPYYYYGTHQSYTVLHKEDWRLVSVNVLLAGAPKIWVIFSAAVAPLVEMKMESLIGHRCCDQFIRERNMWITQIQLKKLKLDQFCTVVVQHPGDVIITHGSSYHQVANFGSNIAVAVNVAPDDYKCPTDYQECQEGICNASTCITAIDLGLRESQQWTRNTHPSKERRTKTIHEESSGKNTPTNNAPPEPIPAEAVVSAAIPAAKDKLKSHTPSNYWLRNAKRARKSPYGILKARSEALSKHKSSTGTLKSIPNSLMRGNGVPIHAQHSHDLRRRKTGSSRSLLQFGSNVEKDYDVLDAEDEDHDSGNELNNEQALPDDGSLAIAKHHNFISTSTEKHVGDNASTDDPSATMSDSIPDNEYPASEASRGSCFSSLAKDYMDTIDDYRKYDDCEASKLGTVNALTLPQSSGLTSVDTTSMSSFPNSNRSLVVDTIPPTHSAMPMLLLPDVSDPEQSPISPPKQTRLDCSGTSSESELTDYISREETLERKLLAASILQADTLIKVQQYRQERIKGRGNGLIYTSNPRKCNVRDLFLEAALFNTSNVLGRRTIAEEIFSRHTEAAKKLNEEAAAQLTTKDAIVGTMNTLNNHTHPKPGHFISESDTCISLHPIKTTFWTSNVRQSKYKPTRDPWIRLFEDAYPDWDKTRLEAHFKTPEFFYLDKLRREGKKWHEIEARIKVPGILMPYDLTNDSMTDTWDYALKVYNELYAPEDGHAFPSNLIDIICNPDQILLDAYSIDDLRQEAAKRRPGWAESLFKPPSARTKRLLLKRIRDDTEEMN